MQTADYQQQSRKIIFEFRTQNIQSAVNFEVYARRQNAEFFGNIVITHAAEAAFQENRPGLFRHFVQRTLQDAENLLLEQPVGIARRQRRDIGLDQPALGTMDSMRRLEVHGLIAQIIQASVPDNREDIRRDIHILREHAPTLPEGHETVRNDVLGNLIVTDITIRPPDKNRPVFEKNLLELPR